MKKLIVLAQIMFLAISAYGQQYPIFSQYFLNPYLYNPAAIGNSGFNELNLTYRQQWLGIRDAPTTQAFNFQYPTRKNISVGAQFYHDKTVLLNSSALTFGLAYQVPISDDHFIKFGLSSGIGLNNFALDEVDNPNDPALQSVLDQTTFLSGQFGVYYQLKGLKLGFSLPQLYKYSAIDTVEFQKITIDQLDNYILTASYRFHLGTSSMSLEPFVLYRKSEQLPAIIEAGAMLDYKDLFWVGGSYRKDYGSTAYVGLNIMKNMSFAYAYEFAGGQQVSLGNGGHEINFKVRFGKNKHQKQPKMLATTVPAAYGAPTLANEGPIEEEQILPELIEPVIISIPIVEEMPTLQNEEETIEFEDIDVEEPEIDPNFNKPKPVFESGYYVVLGAFEVHDNAMLFTEFLNKKGVEVDYGYVDDRGLYYVYNTHTMDFTQADQLKNQFSKLDEFKDVWVYGVR